MTLIVVLGLCVVIAGAGYALGYRRGIAVGAERMYDLIEQGKAPPPRT